MITLPGKLALLVMLYGLLAPALADDAADNAAADQAAEKIDVFVSIAPQRDFVEQVGGDRVAVHVMVGPGQSPELFEPTPRQMARLAGADLYFSIGMPFEASWLPAVRRNNPDLKIVPCCAELAKLAGDGHGGHEHAGHGHGGGDSGMDPHVWTDPNNVIAIAGLIAEALAAHDAAHARDYRRRARAFSEQLRALDSLITARMAALKNRVLIVAHPSWGYFAERYGLSQRSIEQDGKEIQGRSLAQLIEFARRRNIRAVFTQPQFNDRAARVIAAEIGATVYELDPLATGYIENMRAVTDKIARGLGGE